MEYVWNMMAVAVKWGVAYFTVAGIVAVGLVAKEAIGARSVTDPEELEVIADPKVVFTMVMLAVAVGIAWPITVPVSLLIHMYLSIVGSPKPALPKPTEGKTQEKAP